MYKYPIGRYEYSRVVKRANIAYGIAAGLALAMVLIIAWSVQQHNRDVAKINTLTAANQQLEGQNKELHSANKAIGAERDEAVKWLENIQPGINFDGI